MTANQDRTNKPQTDCQDEVIAFLSDPSNYGEDVKRVERIDTHAAMVFLAGTRAYKIKRSVYFPFLDFSSLAKRKWACEREFKLNLRTAPRLYLAVIPILREAEGRLSFGSTLRPFKRSLVVEWVVVMERFPQDMLLDHLARVNKLSNEHCLQLADRIAEFHKKARRVKPRAGEDGLVDLRWVLEENLDELLGLRDFLPRHEVEAFCSKTRLFFAQVAPLLAERAATGYRRHCHGDLHLANICLIDDKPVLFDCLEFDDRLACIDVLYDIAFLLMDLEAQGRREQANLVLNRYLRRQDGEEGLAALPLFLSLRAAIRAKVNAAAALQQKNRRKQDDLGKRVLTYFTKAESYLKPKPPLLVAIGGFSGSGKTSVAEKLAPRLGAAPGALHLRSDQLRKDLWGVEEFAPLPRAAYGKATNEKVYKFIFKKARTALKAGQSVVLDAGFREADVRRTAEELAGETNCPFFGFWLDAPARMLEARVRGRLHDASDATVAVVRAQLEKGTELPTWRRIDASPGLEEVIADIAAKISSRRRRKSLA